MIYAQVDVDFYHHQRSLSLPPSARDLYVAGLCYAKKYLTDGRIPKEEVTHLAPGNPWRKSLERLVRAGLWHDQETCYLINDYGQRNPPAEVDRQRIEAGKARKRRWWERHARRETRPSSEVSSGQALDVPLDRLDQRSTRARTHQHQQFPPTVPPPGDNGWTGKPSQDPARLRPCTVSPLWRNTHDYHEHSRECRFP